MQLVKLALPLLLVNLASVALADARDPVVMLAGEAYGHPALDSDGDLTAVLRNSGADSVDLQVSDGRGLTWSPPIAVDRPLSWDEIQYRQPRVIGSRVFVAFADDRHDKNLLGSLTASTVFLRVYDHTTGNLGPELELPTGIVPEHLAVSSYDFAAHDVGGATHLHLALAQQELDPVSGRIEEQVVLYSSHDGGTSWLAPLELGPAGQMPMDKVRVLADGGQVSVVFRVLRPTTLHQDGLYHQRSLDGGSTVDFPRPRLIPGTRFGRGDFDVDMRGSVFAIAYLGTSNVRAWAATSTDGGVHFHGRTNLKNPLAITGVKETPRIAIAGNGQSICAVSGCSKWVISAVLSADAGVNWAPPEHVTSFGRRPQLVAAGSDRERFVVTYAANPGGAGSQLVVGARVRLAHDTEFGDVIEVLPDASAEFSVTWNDRYQNVIVGYGDFSEQVVGGFRPQEVELHGMTAGSTALYAELSGFDGGGDIGWLLLSTDTTGLILPEGDGRDLGVGVTPLLVSTMAMALGGAFWVPLGPEGSGWTHQVDLPAGIPPGLTLHAVGLSYDMQTGTVVDISDVVTTDT